MHTKLNFWYSGGIRAISIGLLLSYGNSRVGPYQELNLQPNGSIITPTNFAAFAYLLPWLAFFGDFAML